MLSHGFKRAPGVGQSQHDSGLAMNDTPPSHLLGYVSFFFQNRAKLFVAHIFRNMLRSAPSKQLEASLHSADQVVPTPSEVVFSSPGDTVRFDSHQTTPWHLSSIETGASDVTGVWDSVNAQNLEILQPSGNLDPASHGVDVPKFGEIINNDDSAPTGSILNFTLYVSKSYARRAHRSILLFYTTPPRNIFSSRFPSDSSP
jgi:hypothetical protein